MEPKREPALGCLIVFVLALAFLARCTPLGQVSEPQSVEDRLRGIQ
jgi:hypothetical protein